MTFRRLALAIAAMATFPGPSVAAEPLKVVATFSILGDMVRQIGGDDVEVLTLVGPDGDAHVYEPTPADLRTLAEADFLVSNGLGFEAWLPRLKEAAGFHGTEVVASEGVAIRTYAALHEKEREVHDEDHDHAGVDPHAWQNLLNGAIYARNIAAALAKADPANAAGYAGRATAYVQAIESLHLRVTERFAALPPERRKVVSSHDAFGYFAEAYGLVFVAPEGVSTDAEVSAAEVAAIIDQVRAEGISAVFVENIASGALVEQIARETDATVGGALFSDALSPPDGPAPTYLRMFEWNAAQLGKALGTS